MCELGIFVPTTAWWPRGKPRSHLLWLSALWIDLSLPKNGGFIMIYSSPKKDGRWCIFQDFIYWFNLFGGSYIHMLWHFLGGTGNGVSAWDQMGTPSGPQFWTSKVMLVICYVRPEVQRWWLLESWCYPKLWSKMDSVNEWKNLLKYGWLGYCTPILGNWNILKPLKNSDWHMTVSGNGV